jgi:hypothetical protein
MTSGSFSSGPSRTWQDIAFEVEQEENPLRVRALARELNEAMLMEERRRVGQRLRVIPTELCSTCIAIFCLF